MKLPSRSGDGRYGPRRDGAGEEEPPTRLVIVRHGESACALRSVIGGPKGCTGLSEEGVRQVESLAARLSTTNELGAVSALYSSTLQRALETAAILAPALGDLEVTADGDLCELHPGACDGMTWEEATEAFGWVDFSDEPDRVVAPGGESWTVFLSRVRSTLGRLVERHLGQTVVVAGHGGFVDGSLICFLEVPARGSRLDLRTSNASLTEWEVRDLRWRLRRYNDAAHLARSVAPAGPLT